MLGDNESVAYQGIRGLTFSANSQHLLHLARQDAAGWHLVVDGILHTPSYDFILVDPLMTDMWNCSFVGLRRQGDYKPVYQVIRSTFTLGT